VSGFVTATRSRPITSGAFGAWSAWALVEAPTGLTQYPNVAALDTIRTAQIGALTVPNAYAAFPYLATMLEPYPATFIIESTIQSYPGFAGYPTVIQTMQMNGTGNKIGFAVRKGFWAEADPGAPTDWENWSFFELPPANVTTTPQYLYSANGVFGSSPSAPPAYVAAPSTATSAGVAGDLARDASYLYVCIATNTWKRTALATW
jgi:hypothetical protein